MKDCIFCKVVSGELPSKKVYEDSEILAFYDTEPKTPVHVLIIPKKHVKNLMEEKSVDLLGKIQIVATKLAKKLKIDDAFKLTTNNGKSAGQIVHHLHYHLIGGWEDTKDVKSEVRI